MELSYRGYDVNYVTIPKEEKTEISGAVGLTNAGLVKKATAGTDIFAVVVANRGYYATVQTRGYVELKCTGNMPSCGIIKLVANADGTVSQSTSGYEHLVLAVDVTNKIIGFMI